MDDLAGLTAEAEAPAETPATPPVDIEARLTAMQTQFEDRFKGLQRVIATKDKALEDATAKLKEAERAGLSQVEIEELERDETAAENDRLKTEILMLRLKETYADEVPLFQQILEAPSPEEQLKLIRQMRSPAPSTQAAAPEPEPVIPSVDANNPLPHFQSPIPNAPSFQGQPMTEELADRILKGASGMR